MTFIPDEHTIKSLIDCKPHGWWQLDEQKENIMLSDNMLEPLGIKFKSFALTKFVAKVNENYQQKLIDDIRNIDKNYYYSADFPVLTPWGEKWINIRKMNTLPEENIGYITILEEQPDLNEISTKNELLNDYVNQTERISGVLAQLILSDNKADIINLILQRWVKVFEADRISIYKYDLNKRFINCQFQQIDKDKQIKTHSDNAYMDELPWMSREILLGKSVSISSIEELSIIAPSEYEYFREKGIKSFYATPIYDQNGICGYIQVDYILQACTWDAELQSWRKSLLNAFNVCLDLHYKEEDAIKTQNFTQELYKNMPIGYISSNLLFDKNNVIYDYVIDEISNDAQQLLGLTGDAKGRKGSEIVTNKSEFNQFIKLVQGIYNKQQTKYFNAYIPATDKYCSYTVFQSGKDNITSFMADITEIHKANKAINQKEKLLRNMISNLPVAVELYNHKGILVEVNNKCKDIFGLQSTEEVLGMSLFDENNYSDEIKARLHTDETIVFRMNYSFDKMKEVYATNRTGNIDLLTIICKLYDTRGKLCNYVIVYIDQTESNEVYKKLQEFEHAINLVSQFGEIGYSTYDFNSGIGSALPQWLINLNEKENSNVAEVFSHFSNVMPESRAQLLEKIEQLKSNKIDKLSLELAISNNDGTTKWIQFDLMRDNAKKHDNIISISYDITLLKQTEALLLESKEIAEESDRLKMAFLANMSHEIRTPLNAIVGFSELLHETEEQEEREEYVNIIKMNNESLLRLIGDILDLSKIESGAIEVKPDRFDLAKHINELYASWQTRAGEKGLKIHLENPYKVCYVTLDKKITSQIEINYLSNALKYTPSGDITMGYEVVNNGVRFYVTDTGIGIPEEKMDMAFKRFGKLDSYAHGNGLGLSICKALTTACGGDVGVNSKYNEGSTFWAWMPTEVEIMEESETTNDIETNLEPNNMITPETTSTKVTRILVAEDNDSNYMLVNAILRKSYDLTRAINGSEAVKLAQKEQFDVILMDVRMPIMDGLEATREIRKFDEDILIIALTANAFENDKTTALESGMNHFMSKPLKRKELEEILSNRALSN